MLNHCTSEFAISLDDDAHFLTVDSIKNIATYFDNNLNCGLVAFRIFWGSQPPESTFTNDLPIRIKSFVGCGHCWRMSSWRSIPQYPEWFEFYGEEDFASYQLFKKNIEVHYLPSVLVHHRVDLKNRKNAKDYSLRLRLSLRSGWFLFFMFYPLKKLGKIFLYSVWVQLKNKTFKADLKATFAIFRAIVDLILYFPRIIKQNNRLSLNEFHLYKKLPNTKLYWYP